MTGIEKLYRGVWIVPTESLGPRRNEIKIASAPNGEQRRSRRTEIILERRVESHVVGIVEKQVELDVRVAGTRHQRGVERVALGRDHFRVRDSHGVFALDPFGIQPFAYRFAILSRGVFPITANGRPGRAESFFVGVAVLRDD